MIRLRREQRTVRIVIFATTGRVLLADGIPVFWRQEVGAAFGTHHGDCSSGLIKYDLADLVNPPQEGANGRRDR
jgi:hypothetical protein